ncbi:hypothetical protein E2C01_036226 [Portunus trituberculatus]|uniref:Uncharacterized protein n=1 Tax=Portunus trituberculatus TaxID=210409 RepID=A0A5B7FBW6_PORTR|nr:hypothetical protein [Portunus trituberculatus]
MEHKYAPETANIYRTASEVSPGELLSRSRLNTAAAATVASLLKVSSSLGKTQTSQDTQPPVVLASSFL